MSVLSNLEKGLMGLSDVSYDSIDKLMRRLAKDHEITPRELHDKFKAKHDMIPDDWIKKQMKINEEGLRDWFGKSKSKDGKPGWVQSDGSPCANEPGETGTPKCYSSAKKASMSKKELRSADTRKSRQDPGQQQKSGAAKPTYVSTDKPKKKMKEETFNEAEDKKTKGSGTKDACYSKVKSRYSVWPSAYASGALVKCRKVGAANWGNKSEAVEWELDEQWTANTAAEWFVEQGLNEHGVDILIEELGLQDFAELVYELSESTMLTEARSGGVRVEPVNKSGRRVADLTKGARTRAINDLRKKKATDRAGEGEGGKSSMKDALRSQSKVAKARPAVAKARKAQPQVKPTASAPAQKPKKRGILDGVARQVLKGMDRHKKAMQMAKDTGKTIAKAAKVGGAVAKGAVSGVKDTATAAKKVKKAVTNEDISPLTKKYLEMSLDEACWKGYEKKGMKTMFGKRYPNCVKKTTKEETELTEELIIETAFNGLLEEGYEEQDINEAIHWALYEAKVSFGHDTKKPEGLMAKAKKRLGMLGKKARHAVAKGQVAAYNKKREISQAVGDKTRKARQAVGDTVKKVKEAPGRAKSGAKNFVKKQAQKVVDRMSEESELSEMDYQAPPKPPAEIRQNTQKPKKPGVTLPALAGVTAAHGVAAGIEMAAKNKKKSKGAPPVKPAFEEFEGELQEVVRTKPQTGNMYQVIFGWRGKMMMVKLFFPDAKVPNRQHVSAALEKMYPGSQLRSYSISVVDYDDPYINVGEETVHENKEEEKYCRLCEKKEPRSKCAYGGSMWDKYSVDNVDDSEKGEAASDSGITEQDDYNDSVKSRMQSDENRKRTQMRNKHRASRYKQNKSLHSEHSDWRQSMQEDMTGMSQKSGDKRSTDSGAGMTAKGVAKYNRRTGGNLKTAVTTPPSKLKPGSKAAGRRKSFCARSRSWTGERGKAARRRWNC